MPLYSSVGNRVRLRLKKKKFQEVGEMWRDVLQSLAEKGWTEIRQVVCVRRKKVLLVCFYLEKALILLEMLRRKE